MNFFNKIDLLEAEAPLSWAVNMMKQSTACN